MTLSQVMVNKVNRKLNFSSFIANRRLRFITVVEFSLQKQCFTKTPIKKDLRLRLFFGVSMDTQFSSIEDEILLK